MDSLPPGWVCDKDTWFDYNRYRNLSIRSGLCAYVTKQETGYTVYLWVTEKEAVAYPGRWRTIGDFSTLEAAIMAAELLI